MPTEPNSPTQDSVDDGWLENPPDELPRRPRRRLLGVGGNPIPVALIGVLLVACGFIGGVLVEKGQSSSGVSSSASGLASRFVALRSGAAAGGGSGLGSRSAAGGAPGAFVGGAGTGGTTIGQVAYVSGHTLYVTNSEGNTIKVKTSAASAISKTIKSEVKGIHPGETVLVSGSAGANGTIRAESIRVGQAGSAPLGALLGGAGGLGGAGRGAGTRARGAGTENGSAGPGEGPVLFGK